ncbi:MAG: Flp pilus assembly protein CpaB [Anaerolineae bacterium]
MGRLRGFLWLIAGLVVAALAGGVAFIALSRATAEEAGGAPLLQPEESVVVATRRVEARALLTEEDVELVEVSVDTVPENAVRDVEEVVGKLTLVELYAGEVVLSERLLDPNVQAPNGRLALVMAEDEVLMAFPAGDLLSQVNMLKAGDRVDFLFTYELPVDREVGALPVTPSGTTVQAEGEEGEETEPVTFNLMQNVTIAALVRQVNEEGEETGSPRALLLAINPQDALVLKYMKDVGATVDLVLRAPGAEGEFSVEPVDLDYVINGYIAPTEGLP